ncbi:Rhodanese-related sulfurtransferase [Palleronia marisminoris]|uniref:Molybdopterin biosynthesis protein MoeB n=1 Tax=Palleronia marisminoris TaxID=315423 RepID=A0A1Y5SLA4_9RHOB|nr:rhodanese-like domain-containing protein [Palleronia marisminoris]SFG86607.1 Rhodanese-related sulfurtransferase [Palleronia marisminoris]SLN42809.1 molybdopterin biosynthesis protein MoeB [Palleronia marisminoris]
MPITPVETLVANAKARIETLALEEARARAERGDALLVDIRDVRELDRQGRVPGAVHAPRGMLEFWVDPESPYHREVFATDKQLILFCAGAMRSALAVATLRDMGLENVAEMDEGFAGWTARGLPVEKRD